MFCNKAGPEAAYPQVGGATVPAISNLPPPLGSVHTGTQVGSYATNLADLNSNRCLRELRCLPEGKTIMVCGRLLDP